MPIYSEQRQEFLRLFRTVSPSQHRYRVFQDFVTTSAIALHNATNKVEALEQEYLGIIKKYSKDDIQSMCHMLGCVIEMLEAKETPYDVLGELFMDLELGNKGTAQFFTPFNVSSMMAEITYCDSIANSSEPFLTFADPCCGAGSMPLAFAKVLIKQKRNPANDVFMQCIDIDRTVALMCFIQLSLWNIPAQVIVGDSLKMEFHEQWYTPAYWMFGWDEKRRIHEMIDAFHTLLKSADNPEEENDTADYDGESKASLFDQQLSLFDFVAPKD